MFARLGFAGAHGITLRFSVCSAVTGVSPGNGATGTGGAHVFNGTISASYAFGPHLFVDAYFGYNRGDLWANQPDQDKNLGWTMLAIPGLNTSGLSPTGSASRAACPACYRWLHDLGRSNTYRALRRPRSRTELQRQCQLAQRNA